jgi:hypothetical protein
LSSTRQANQYYVTPAGESAGQQFNRVFERHRIAADAPVQADLRRKLAAVIAEQEDRARMAADARA